MWYFPLVAVTRPPKTPFTFPTANMSSSTAHVAEWPVCTVVRPKTIPVTGYISGTHPSGAFPTLAIPALSALYCHHSSSDSQILDHNNSPPFVLVQNKKNCRRRPAAVAVVVADGVSWEIRPRISPVSAKLLFPHGVLA